MPSSKHETPIYGNPFSCVSSLVVTLSPVLRFCASARSAAVLAVARSAAVLWPATTKGGWLSALPHIINMVGQSIIARFGIAFAVLAARARGEVVDITGEVRPRLLSNLNLRIVDIDTTQQ